MENYVIFVIITMSSVFGVITFTNLAFAAEDINIDSTQYIENVSDLLKSVSSEYKAGNFNYAEELAKTAYLDNFEYVESDLVKNGAGELKEEIEQMMRVELLAMIKNRASQEEIDTKIMAIDNKLTEAYAKVPEFPLGATLVLTSLVGAIIAITKLKGIKLVN